MDRAGRRLDRIGAQEIVGDQAIRAPGDFDSGERTRDAENVAQRRQQRALTGVVAEHECAIDIPEQKFPWSHAGSMAVPPVRASTPNIGLPVFDSRRCGLVSRVPRCT